MRVKRAKTNKHGSAKGWPRTLERGGLLIQVTITAFVWAKIRDFKTGSLIEQGWPLNTRPVFVLLFSDKCT